MRVRLFKREDGYNNIALAAAAVTGAVIVMAATGNTAPIRSLMPTLRRIGIKTGEVMQEAGVEVARAAT